MATLINGLGGTAGFGENYLERNDDSYQNSIDLTSTFGAQGLNFFGTSYTSLAVNNNGNITFGSYGLSTYTPFGLQTGGYAIIAPFFGDVDTRLYSGGSSVTPTAGGTSTGSDLVWYDFDPTGYGVMTITWDDVGYYSSSTDKLNAFQLQLTGTGNGNFTVAFRYEAINWTTGDASSGSNGLGGVIARAGYSTGDGSTWYELPVSGDQAGMLTLEDSLGNTGAAGYWSFSVTGGTSGNDTLTGQATDDILSGGTGNDILDGGIGGDTLTGGEGSDTLTGGDGNDIYIIDIFDTLFETLGGGIDIIMADFSYTLPDYFEELILTGTSSVDATGNALDNILGSNSGNNIINGMGAFNLASYDQAHYGVTVNLGVTISQNTNDGYDTLINIQGVIGSRYNDTLTGGGGNDQFEGGGGDDIITGGSGVDTAVYGGDLTAENYAGTFATDGSLIITGAAGTDTLSGIERLVFDNQRVAFDISASGNAGQAYELVYAAFDAAPSAELIHWIAAFDEGQSMAQVAQSMLDYYVPSGVSNEVLVSLLYTNLVGAAPDQGTTAYFSSMISSGQYTQAGFIVMAAQHEANMVQSINQLNGFLFY
jgi:hypothetical protein